MIQLRRAVWGYDVQEVNQYIRKFKSLSELEIDYLQRLIVKVRKELTQGNARLDFIALAGGGHRDHEVPIVALAAAVETGTVSLVRTTGAPVVVDATPVEAAAP